MGKGPLKTAPAQGRGCPGSDIPPGHVHARPRSTEAPAPAPQPQPQPQPRPRPEGADVIRSRGPSRLAAGMRCAIPGALAAQSSWDSCPA